MAELRNVRKVLPQIDGWRYDFRDGRFIDRSGSEIGTGRFEDAIDGGRTWDHGIGLATVQRAVITASAIEELQRGTPAEALATPVSAHGASGTAYSLGAYRSRLRGALDRADAPPEYRRRAVDVARKRLVEIERRHRARVAEEGVGRAEALGMFLERMNAEADKRRPDSQRPPSSPRSPLRPEGSLPSRAGSPDCRRYAETGWIIKKCDGGSPPPLPSGGRIWNRKSGQEVAKMVFWAPARRTP